MRNAAGTWAVAVMLLGSCGGGPVSTTPPTAVGTTLDRVAEDIGGRVVVEGYLTTDSSIHCGTGCWLWVTADPIDDDGVTYGQPTGAFAHVVIPEETYSWGPYPSTIRHFSTPWQPEDVIVTSSDGREVHLNDRVRVTGWVEEKSEDAVITGPKPCHDMRPEDKRATWEAGACPDTGFQIVLLGG